VHADEEGMMLSEGTHMEGMDDEVMGGMSDYDDDDVVDPVLAYCNLPTEDNLHLQPLPTPLLPNSMMDAIARSGAPASVAGQAGPSDRAAALQWSSEMGAAVGVDPRAVSSRNLLVPSLEKPKGLLELQQNGPVGVLFDVAKVPLRDRPGATKAHVDMLKKLTTVALSATTKVTGISTGAVSDAVTAAMQWLSARGELKKNDPRQLEELTQEVRESLGVNVRGRTFRKRLLERIPSVKFVEYREGTGLYKLESLEKMMAVQLYHLKELNMIFPSEAPSEVAHAHESPSVIKTIGNQWRAAGVFQFPGEENLGWQVFPTNIARDIIQAKRAYDEYLQTQLANDGGGLAATGPETDAQPAVTGAATAPMKILERTTTDALHYPGTWKWTLNFEEQTVDVTSPSAPSIRTARLRWGSFFVSTVLLWVWSGE
jgi:hypothetical protein